MAPEETSRTGGGIQETPQVAEVVTPEDKYRHMSRTGKIEEAAGF